MVQRAHLWRGRLLSPGFSCAASVRHVIADLLLFCMPPLASVCSAHFLNNGFCCRMVHVDSKRAAVTLVSSQQILIPVEASRPPGRALRAPLSLVSLLLRQLQHKVGRVGGVVCVCVCWEGTAYLIKVHLSLDIPLFWNHIQAVFLACPPLHTYSHLLRIEKMLQGRSGFWACFCFT